jgi:hypothetical protein
MKFFYIGLPGARTRNSSDESGFFLSLISWTEKISSQTVLAIFIAHGFLCVYIEYKHIKGNTSFLLLCRLIKSFIVSLTKKKRVN